MRKVLILSGAGSGLAKALTSQAVDAGIDVFAISRKPIEEPAAVHVTVAELSDPEQTSRAFESIAKEIGKDASPFLVNLTGKYTQESVPETNRDVLQASFEGNFLTVFNATKALVENFDGGKAMVLTGQNAHLKTGNSAAYASMKLAAERLFDTFRAEYQSKGFNFLTVVSGPINTWSDKKEPNTADKTELAHFILSLMEDRSFWPDRIEIRPR